MYAVILDSTTPLQRFIFERTLPYTGSWRPPPAPPRIARYSTIAIPSCSAISKSSSAGPWKTPSGLSSMSFK